MMDKTNKNILVGFTLLKRMDFGYSLHFNENEISELFENSLTADELMESLSFLAEKKAITYLVGGEDGFIPIYDITIKQDIFFAVFHQIYVEYNSYLHEIIGQQTEEIRNIYGFLPNSMIQDIDESKKALKSIFINIQGHEFLKPLEPKLEEIRTYLNKTEKVIRNYENIYLNIIKPIKQDSKKGIWATVVIGIIGIVATAIVSFYFSYKTFSSKVEQEIQANNTEQVDGEFPIVSTQEVSNIDVEARTATFNGIIEFAGNPQYFERGFVYGKSYNPTIKDMKLSVSGLGAGEFSVNAQIEEGNTYYVRAYAKYKNGIIYGKATSFSKVKYTK